MKKVFLEIYEWYVFFIQISLKMKFLPLTFWLAFLHSPSACSSKVSLLSFFIPKNFSLHVLESFSLQISIWWLFLSLRRRWNLSEFTFIQLFRNHKLRLSATPLISLITFNSELQMECYHLLLTKSIFCLNRKRSQRKTLKISGPNMEPCGTPCSIFVQLLDVLFIFIFSFRWLR